MGCSASRPAVTAKVTPTAPAPPTEANDKKTSRRSSEVPRPPGLESRWRMSGTILGTGQFGTVYEATEIVSTPNAVPRIAAIKVMQKSRLTPEDLLALSVEISAMTRLSKNDAFVELYEVFDEPTVMYIVMELVVGGELFDRIVNKEKYTEREARDVIRQLANAIAFAHSVGVAHRDLKPENILLKSRDDDTSFKIADMGFAKVFPPEKQDIRMTTPCGTPTYVAPEILSRNPYGTQADIWSLGVIFFILLAGYPPFFEDDQPALFEAIKAGRYNFDPRDWGQISPGAKDLVSKILVVDPLKRYTSSEILAHPWMQADAATLPNVMLASTQQQLRQFNAKRKLRRAINGVRTAYRLKKMISKSSRAGTEASSADLTADEASCASLAT